MADRYETGIPSGKPADAAVTAVLKEIEDVIRDGTVSSYGFRPDDDESRQRMEELLAGITATQQFALAMANGDLSRDLPLKGYLAGSLKALQSNLRHLTWQTGQIAQGDLSQRVHFMGDFSDSFNAMVGHLAQNEIDRTRREQELLAANTALMLEITERRRTEGALRLTNRKLNLLSSITRHDIRNQLTALSAYLYLNREASGDPVATAMYLDKEDRILATIISQINFTRDYENLGVEEPVWNNVASIIAEVTKELPFGNVQLVTTTGGAGMYADPLAAKVFYNLIDNALRYGGEKITEIRIGAEVTPGGLVITVQDDGAGIATGDREHLFTKGFGKNTGFGLHLSREILSLTSITIAEDSDPGGGARFRITVPAGAYRFH
jgi:signal transduction histidine kinase